MAGSTINSVTVRARCAVTVASGNGTFRTVLRTYSTNYYGTTFSPSNTSYQDISTVYTVNPNTGQPWTITELNALQVGVDLKSHSAGSENFGTWCTQVYAEVDYTPAPVIGTLAVTFPIPTASMDGNLQVCGTVGVTWPLFTMALFPPIIGDLRAKLDSRVLDADTDMGTRFFVKTSK